MCAREHSQNIVGGTDDVLCLKKFFDPYLIYLRILFKKSKNLTLVPDPTPESSAY